MKVVGNSKTFKERFQPRPQSPQSLLIVKREDPGEFPGDEGGILVPDLTLTPHFKMAAIEDS